MKQFYYDYWKAYTGDDWKLLAVLFWALLLVIPHLSVPLCCILFINLSWDMDRYLIYIEMKHLIVLFKTIQMIYSKDEQENFQFSYN